MKKRCFDCGKEYDEIAVVEMFGILPACVWCIKKQAATRELMPDFDNLRVCPRCEDREILTNEGICHACMSEVNSYYG